MAKFTHSTGAPRRAMLVALAAVPLVTLGFALETDDELVALGEQLARESEGYLDLQGEALLQVYGVCARLVWRILEIPSRSVAGLKVKAAALRFCLGGESLEREDDTTDVALIAQIVSDIEAL